MSNWKRRDTINNRQRKAGTNSKVKFFLYTTGDYYHTPCPNRCKWEVDILLTVSRVLWNWARRLSLRSCTSASLSSSWPRSTICSSRDKRARRGDACSEDSCRVWGKWEREWNKKERDIMSLTSESRNREWDMPRNQKYKMNVHLQQWNKVTKEWSKGKRTVDAKDSKKKEKRKKNLPHNSQREAHFFVPHRICELYPEERHGKVKYTTGSNATKKKKSIKAGERKIAMSNIYMSKMNLYMLILKKV